MFVDYIQLAGIIIELKKYDFIRLEKEGRAKMLFATGADLYANKSYLASLLGDDVRASDVEKELPKMLRDFDKKMSTVGKDIKDGSISYGVMFMIDDCLFSYEKGIKYLEEHYKRD